MPLQRRLARLQRLRELLHPFEYDIPGIVLDVAAQLIDELFVRLVKGLICAVQGTGIKLFALGLEVAVTQGGAHAGAAVALTRSG